MHVDMNILIGIRRLQPAERPGQLTNRAGCDSISDVSSFLTPPFISTVAAAIRLPDRKKNVYAGIIVKNAQPKNYR